jgi:type I restriction-modification system DNA methylase subunit
MFRPISVKMNAQLSKTERKKEGIFITPLKVRQRLFDVSRPHVQPRSILEPSFGTGEFLLDAQEQFPSATLTGVEKNTALFNSFSSEGMTLICADFLEWKGGTFDFIVANPPYFVMETEEKFTYMSRPNIYILFLYKCLTQHLAPNGVMSFVVPTSIYNCSYYQGMRDYLYEHTTILHVETLEKPGFKDTAQKTCLLVLQQGKKNDNFWFRRNYNYLSPHAEELTELTRNTTTLAELGLKVKTGNVVWNQHKSNLSDSGTLLLYASNLTASELTFPPLAAPKQQYVKGLKKPTLKGRFILASRGYGNSSTFHAVDVSFPEFYAENHINVIYSPEGNTEAFERVLRTFHGTLGQTFMTLFIGNGAMSSKELETIFPIE